MGLRASADDLLPRPHQCTKPEPLIVWRHERAVPIARMVGRKRLSVAVEEHSERDARHSPWPAGDAPADIVLQAPRTAPFPRSCRRARRRRAATWPPACRTGRGPAARHRPPPFGRALNALFGRAPDLSALLALSAQAPSIASTASAFRRRCCAWHHSRCTQRKAVFAAANSARPAPWRRRALSVARPG